MTEQLTLALQPRRTPSRQQPAIERLRAVMTRQGIDWHYRALKGNVLVRPLLGVRFGWQLMCGYYGCGQLVFERVDYCDRPALTADERAELHGWVTEKREQIYELWGRP